MQFKRILVAIDDSEFAAHAVEVAASLAAAVSGQIGLVHVIDPKCMSSETGVPADQQWALLRSDGRALLAAARAAIPGDPHPWEFLREGTPWKEIVESAGEWSADIIVVGTHGRRGVGRLVFGSTAEGVVRHAPCPVVVVPPKTSGSV